MASETLRDVTIRVSIKQGDATLKVPDFKPADVSLKSAAASIKTVSAGTDEVAKKAKQAADEIERFKKLDEAKLKAVAVGDSFKAAGEGAFTMARGAAFLFTSTDDGFAKMAANIAKVQGGFDLFKGSFETVKGLTEGVVKLKAATGAATVGTALYTGANTALAVSLAGVKTAALATYAALGPIGTVAAAVAAAGAAIYAGWKWFGSSEPAKNIKKTGEELDGLQKKALQLGGALEDAPDLRKKLEDAFKAGEDSAALEDKKTEIFREQAKLAGRQFNFEGRRLSLAKEAEKHQRLQVKAAEELSKWTEHDSDKTELKLNIQRAKFQFQTGMVESAKKLAEYSKAEGDDLARRKTDNEALLKSTEERIKAEKDALLSGEAKFGQLTKREQQRAIEIAKRGISTKSEAEAISKAGGEALSQQFLAKRGREGGFGEFAKAAGITHADDLRKLETERGQINSRLEQVKSALASNERQQINLLNGILTELEKLPKIQDEINRLEGRLLRMQQLKAASKQ